MAVSKSLIVALASLLAAVLLGACSDSADRRTESDLEEAGKTAVRNVERSQKIMADTYDEKRKQGEGRIEAAGDAYNEVLDAGRE